MTDRRFGVFGAFGSGTLFGPSDTRQALAWDCSIDWNDDGLFESNEANRMTKIKIRRGRTKLLRAKGDGFERIRKGETVIELTNRDGRYDAWNESSALYPNVSYGKDIRIRVRDLSGSEDPYPLFRGVISNIVPVGSGRDRKVIIYAHDGMEFLRNTTGRVALQTDITPSAAIGLVLDAVGWPSRWGRSLDSSSDNINYWWSSGDKLAASEIEDLAQSFLSYFFVNATGQAEFLSRGTIATPVAEYDQQYLLKEIGNPQPYEISRNITRLKVHPRTQAATGTIWQLLGNVPSVQDGAANAIKLFADYTYNNQRVPAENVAIEEFEMNTQQDGLGADVTASCTATVTNLGDTGLVNVTNESGGLAYLITLKLEGDAIYEQNVADVTYPRDTSTIKAPRELKIDLPWQQDLNVARDLADVIGPFYSGTHPMPTVQIENRPSLQFVADLFDIAVAQIDKLGLEGESFRVGGIEHESIGGFENCQAIRSKLFMEPYISADDYWTWPAVWETSTIFGW